MNSFKQYLTIILSTFLVGAIIYTPLSSYITYIVGFLIVLSLTYIFAKRKQNIAETFSNSFVFIFVALIGTLLIIFLTGGIASPLFFLLYFLIFATPFMFEPFAVVIFFIGLMALFIVPAFENDVFSNMVRIGSIVFITPLAFFFGREFKKKGKENEKTNKPLPKSESQKQRIINPPQ